MKKKISGRFKEYILEKKVKSVADGEIYLINGGEGEGLCAKFLSDRSDFKKNEVEASLQGASASSIIDIPLDIAFLRGRFVGYIYQDFNSWNEASISAGHTKTDFNEMLDAGNTLESGTPGGSASDAGSLWNRAEGLDNPFLKWGGLCIMILLLSVLNLNVFYGMFLSLAARIFSDEVFSGCELLGGSGVTSIIIGLACSGYLCTKLSRLGTLQFLAFEAAGFLAGILLADVLIVAAIKMIIGVVGFLTALLPVLILIAGLWLVFKSIFRR